MEERLWLREALTGRGTSPDRQLSAVCGMGCTSLFLAALLVPSEVPSAQMCIQHCRKGTDRFGVCAAFPWAPFCRNPIAPGVKRV